MHKAEKNGKTADRDLTRQGVRGEGEFEVLGGGILPSCAHSSGTSAEHDRGRLRFLQVRYGYG
jgi:hypothetical protein